MSVRDHESRDWAYKNKLVYYLVRNDKREATGFQVSLARLAATAFCMPSSRRAGHQTDQC